ncbi:MAG: winged helix-turn-helix domain-containing protein, partial [Povalibacter sp.]
MDTVNPTIARVAFDDFEADLRTQELLRSGRRVRLPNQSFVVLATLLSRPGELISREDLRKALWPKETYVEYDQALNAAVNRLREALRDSADAPRYIETLPRRGYRFIAAIKPAVESAATVPDEKATPTKMKPRVPWTAIVGGLLTVSAIAWSLLRGSGIEQATPTLSPLTSLPNREVAPTFSPSGNEVAFAWNGERADGPGFDLYVKG